MDYKRIHAVLDEEMGSLLEAIGEAENVRNGNVLCKFCGNPVSIQSLQILVPHDDGQLDFICSNPECLHSFRCGEGE